MVNFHSKSMVEAIANFTENKTKLESILSNAQGELDVRTENSIREAERGVESSFCDFLSLQPNDLHELLEKCELIIDEIKTESELTSYHEKGLRSIVDSISALTMQSRSQSGPI